MREVFIQTTQPMSTGEANEIMVKILYSNYDKSDLEQVASNAFQQNYDEITNILSLLNEFEDFFDGIIGEWYTEILYLELNTYAKPVNIKYHPLTRIKKETSRK